MGLELSRMIDAIPGLAWTALPDGRTEFINQRWCEYTGLSLHEALGLGWQGAIHPDDLAAVLKHWRSLREAERSGETVARLRRHDGQYRRFLMSIAPITDDSGRVVKWCGFNVDIEERLATQDADAHFTVAQRLSATGSFVSDLVADRHIWSDELYRVFERDPAMPPNLQAARDAVHPEDRESYDAQIARALAGHEIDFEFRIVTPRGAVKHLRASGRISERIEGRPVFMGAVQDVTQSKIAEAELRRAHHHLTEAQRLSKTGSFTADLASDEHTWSEEFYRICEFEPGSRITTQKLQDIVLPEDLPQFQGAIERAIAGEEPVFVFRIVTARGVLKYLRGAAHRLGQVSDRPVFIGAVQDVTESKVAEDALNKARSELTHVARVMTLGALTASIAHEVNQPLAGIITNASTCLRMLAADPPNVDGARATAQRTLRDGNRASEVIQRLRGLFARKQPTPEPLDLNDAAREVLALSSSELQGNRVVVRTELDPALPAVLGDRVQLQQVILNLILNATDAMKAVDDRPRTLLLTTANEDADQVRLSVCDCGVGLDEQNLGKLFDAFYTTKTGGMGVGLAISRSIIENHQGRLWASANEGPGATFSFSIPCRSGPAPTDTFV